MNSRNSKASDPHRLLINLSDKTNLTKSDRYIGLSILSIHYTWKNIKKLYRSYIRTINLKNNLRHDMK